MFHGMISKSFAILLAMSAPGPALTMEHQASLDDAQEHGRRQGERQTNMPLAAGRVVRVEPGAGRITIEQTHQTHPTQESMTMIFRVRDPTMLVGLAPGGRIRFEVQRDGRSYVIVRIENSN